MLVGDFQGLKIYRAVPEDKLTRKDGTPREPRRLGKIHLAVFTPDGRRMIGFMVSPPDIAGMIKQPDRFVPFDALSWYEGVLVVADSKASYDKAAAERLGVDLDACIVWCGMDVVTEAGKTLGYCSNAAFNPKTGVVTAFTVTAGAAATALLGTVEMPASMVRGYRDGAMIVSDDAAELDVSGGMAAKAAEATVVISDKVKSGARKLDEHGSVAVEKGSRALGKQLGKTKGMFKAFKEEYKKASGSAGSSAKKKSKR